MFPGASIRLGLPRAKRYPADFVLFLESTGSRWEGAGSDQVLTATDNYFQPPTALFLLGIRLSEFLVLPEDSLEIA